MARLYYSLIAACILFSSCVGNPRAQEEAELSAFGSYVYRLDTLKMLENTKELIASDTSRWKADRVVAENYKKLDMKQSSPLWFNRMGVSEQADSLVSFLRRELPLNGLDSTAFFLPQISADLRIVHELSFDSLSIDINKLLSRLDYFLTKAYVRYVAGQRYGFMRPGKIFNNLELKPDLDKKPSQQKAKEYQRLFDYECAEPDYAEAYGMLSSDKRFDFLLSSAPSTPVYKAFYSQMETCTDAEERQTLAVNMERCRWKMKSPVQNEKCVIVNIPAQQLWAVCADSVLNMRICCGATNHKTPLLCSEFKYMQVNPDWIVPKNIIKTDFLRHAGDTAYFIRNQYYIVDRNSGDTLSPALVTAEEMVEPYIRIGQKSGEGNSLGRIVFRFDNDFGVYLHDTNNRKAFTRDRRTLSHGCVRVQKPFELACFMMSDADDWTLDRLRLSIDIAPETERGAKYLKEHQDDERPLRLLTYREISPRIPLYIIYYTAYPNPETGKVELWPDLYGYDKVIKALLPM